MKKQKHTWQAFCTQAEQVEKRQQTQLKGGYRTAPVQVSVPTSNIIWTEIDIRSNNLSQQVEKDINSRLFVDRL